MRRILSALIVAGALSLGATALAQPEGEGQRGSIASEGHGVTEAAACTAASSDEQCAEYWEEHLNWWSFDYKPGPHQAPEHRHMPAPLGVEIINFLIFAGVLYRLAAKPLRDYVRERHLAIRKDLDEAAALRAAAKARLDDAERRLAAVEDEIARLVAGIRREAEAEKVRLIAAADADAARIRAGAAAQVAGEIDRLRREVRAEVVQSAVAAAEKLLREQTNPDDQRRLVERYLQQMEVRA